MKCRNPDCSNPSYLANLLALGLLDIKFCPVCGTNFDSSTSQDTNPDSEVANQTSGTESTSFHNSNEASNESVSPENELQTYQDDNNTNDIHVTQRLDDGHGGPTSTPGVEDQKDVIIATFISDEPVNDEEQNLAVKDEVSSTIEPNNRPFNVAEENTNFSKDHDSVVASGSEETEKKIAPENRRWSSTTVINVEHHYHSKNVADGDGQPTSLPNTEGTDKSGTRHIKTPPETVVIADAEGNLSSPPCSTTETDTSQTGQRFSDPQISSENVAEADEQPSSPPSIAATDTSETEPTSSDIQRSPPENVADVDDQTPSASNTTGTDASGIGKPSSDPKRSLPENAADVDDQTPSASTTGTDASGTGQTSSDLERPSENIADAEGKLSSPPSITGKETGPTSSDLERPSENIADAEGKLSSPPSITGEKTGPTSSDLERPSGNIADAEGKLSSPPSITGKETGQTSSDLERPSGNIADAEGKLSSPPSITGKETGQTSSDLERPSGNIADAEGKLSSPPSITGKETGQTSDIQRSSGNAADVDEQPSSSSQATRTTDKADSRETSLDRQKPSEKKKDDDDSSASSGADNTTGPTQESGYFYQKPSLLDKNGKSNKKKNESSDKNQEETRKLQSSQDSQCTDDYSTKPDSVTIVFHALLAPYFQFDEQRDRVVVRGGSPHFNGWHADQLEMKPIRSLHDGHVLIEGTTQIQSRLAHRINYKYVVSIGGNKKTKWIFEELVGHHGYGITNRFCSIPERYCKANGLWHQYDDVIFGPPEKFFDQPILNKLPIFKSMDPAEGRFIAMQAMLPDWDSFGTIETSSTRQGSDVLETINQVIYCMASASVENNSYTTQRCSVDGFSLENAILSYVSPRLRKNMELQLTTKDEKVHAYCFATSLAIASIASNCIKRFSYRPSKEVLKLLFQCLAFSQSLEQHKIQKIIETLSQYYPLNKWTILIDAMSDLCHYTTTNEGDIHEWLLAVPLIHFMSGVVQPYCSSSSLPSEPSQDNSFWGSDRIIYKDARESLLGFRHELQPMFQLDPLLRRTFIFALPLTRLGEVAKQKEFSPHEVCWAIVEKLKNRGFLVDKEISSLTECLNTMLTSLREGEFSANSAGNFSPEKEEIVSLAKAACEVLDRLQSLLKDNIFIICGFLSLLGNTLSTINAQLHLEKPTEIEQEGLSEKLLKTVSDKIKSRLMKVFGTMNFGYASEVSKTEELEIWSRILSAEIPDAKLQSVWQKDLIYGLETRIQKMDDMHRIDFYSKYNFGPSHQLVQECFKDAAFEAIKKVIEDGRAPEHKQAFNSISRNAGNSGQSKKVGEMMSLLLERCWPNKTEQNDDKQHKLLNHILTWSPMADYLRYFNEGEKSLVFSEKSQELLACATSRLEDDRSKVLDASVTVATLRILRKTKNKFLELIDLLNDSDDEESDDDEHDESDDEESDDDELDQSLDRNFSSTLQDRFHELDAFEKEREHLDLFLNIHTILQNVAVQDIRENVNTDVADYEIGDLAVHVQDSGRNTRIQVIFFGLSDDLKQMVSRLHHIYQSELFQHIWNSKFKDAQQVMDDENMSLDVVLESVWKPTFKKCKYLINAVLTGEISLADVDKNLELYKDRHEILERDLDIIAKACSEGVEEVPTQVKKIQRYHQLKSRIGTAEKILRFQDEMELSEGDFTMVEEFHQQISPETKGESLNSFHEQFNETGQKLQELSARKIKCLDAVVDSKDFINWLKKEVPDSSEIKVLVDLAMISAGEGDIESDRINALDNSARAFRPIIYDLDKNTGFEELLVLCEDIWKALDDNPRLPQQLLDTSRNLEWLKNVKDFHGSAAMSSLKQVETINEYGTLTIGCQGNGDEIDLSKAITLRIPTDKVKGLRKETYSLDELKDLQSKLMLIAGKSSGKKEDVEKFTEILQGAITVGTAYIALCESGEVSHLNWRKDFSCASLRGRKDTTSDLRREGDELTHYYKAWIAVLDAQRKECVELNFFTAKQLLYLRKEIADLRRSHDLGSLEVQLYMLLDSVLPGVSSQVLQQALIAIDIDVDDPIIPENQSLRMVIDDDQTEQNLMERYKEFFDGIEELEYSEEVGLAAIVACNCPKKESELFVWCIKNKQNDDLIEEICERGSRNPLYATLFPQAHNEEVAANEEKEEVEDMEIERSDKETDENDYISKLDQTCDGRHLSLQELSTLLTSLAAGIQGDTQTMKFPNYLKKGVPNLLIVPQGDILATVIGLYLESDVSPSRHEVLVCTQDTTPEEVGLLWRRALANKGDKFYFLANANELSLGDSGQAMESLNKLTNEYDNDEYQLVVICSSEQETKSQMATALDRYQVKGAPRCPRPNEVLIYLEHYFTAPPTKTVNFGNHEIDWVPAAEVERRNRLSVLVISSHRSGTGKSLIVQDFVQELEQLPNNQTMTQLLEDRGEHLAKYIIVPLLGKTANLSDAVGFLLPYSLNSNVPVSRIFHFDVSPSVEFGLDTLLFNLLYLGSVQDRRGRVWIRNPRDLYAIEMTSENNQQNVRKAKDIVRHNFYNELPAMHCIAPDEVLKEMKKENDEVIPLFNEKKFQSEAVQRVFQYLQHLQYQPEMLHVFEFDPQQLDFDAAECLHLLIRYCGVNNPSWAELQHFVDFLNYQLTDCEQSAFCQLENVADTLEGFRLFVVLFMTIMSQDFSTRSLGDHVQDQPEAEEEQDIVQFQLRRRWENSLHPYLFFNPDHATFTFLGFRIDLEGNLIDPSSGDVIKENLMTRHLRTGLHVQRVNLEENFESLTKEDKINKICKVLGVEWPYDPDETYELTEDNAKKILAIHMRFRCGIPVVVMGETGCGKTKLIRYLCGLQRGMIGPKNMLLVKVHGGTTFRDIENKVQQAKNMARQNIENGVETVLFFDEVNTTEALDLVKEIMVDRRLNGRPLGQEADGLRFIAACNPYRKHTDTMIEKLESAGLGYSVRTQDINDRIGRVPLRHLVYRVHALPESMCSLIWDFGQLNPEIEVLYTRQIVKRYLTQGDQDGHGIPNDDSLVEAITSVLAESQRYMREQKDECSFVSLRDVERTMNVMIWFYEHREVFRPLLEASARLEESHQENQQSDSDDSSDDSNSKSHSDQEESEDKRPCYFQRAKKPSPAAKRVLKEDLSAPSTSGLRPQEFGVYDGDEDEDLILERRPSPFHRFMEMRLPTGTGTEPVPIYDEEQQDDEAAVVDDDDDDDDDDDLDNITKIIDPITWSLVLAIGVCYHAKLQNREQYREAIAQAFRRPCALYGGADRILQEISRCQKAVLKELDLAPNIAKNTALSENVFMMVVCIELRIPLFVIGKPGSSKSLAKTVVANNMQGDASKSKLFKSFKEIRVLAHQCSPLSTPEGIQETFRQCSNLQKDKNPDKFVSVVVLDEVGLAEESPQLPLKTLHPLLEDGVTSSDDIIETDEKPTRVAFIGISNWALDPAKMNRGIMLSRDVPGLKELTDSAMGICASDKNVQDRIAPIIPSLAEAYSQLYDEQKEVLKDSKKEEFFGLRDFYSLIKMIFAAAKDKPLVHNWKDIEYAVRRNFGGLDVDGFNPVDIFRQNLQNVLTRVTEDESEEKREFSSLNLIKSYLDKDPTEEESRYLLILTENHAALTIVQQYLKHSNIYEDENDPVLIFGSSFPKDLEYTQVCRNINDIKVCMETGRTVILLNMESLYEGLYDALNQYYVEFSGNKYVDLGLGTHRVKCRVDPHFRLIVIAEKSTVYKEFPIPLINRLEKHFLVLSTSLTPPQEDLARRLTDWVGRFAQINTPQHQRKRTFTKGDAFVGYHEDTIPAVVLSVCSSLGEDGTNLDDDERKEEWEDMVLSESKRLLIQCCTPDAIVRLHSSGLTNEADKIWDLYFKQQQHSSLASFLTNVDKTKHKDGLLIQVSTHSRLLSENNLDEIAEGLNLHRHYMSCITLQQFQTAQQFCDSIGNFFAHLGGDEGLLIVQCIPGDLTFNLLACARHLLLKQRAEVTEEAQDIAPIHIIVIIQLPRIPGGYPDFVGFQGQQWESIHIDELFTPSFYVPTLENVKDQSLSVLFEASIKMCFTESKEQVIDAVDVIRQSVQAAAGRIDDGPTTVARATKRIVILLELLSKDANNTHTHDTNALPHALICRVHELLKEKDERTNAQGANWSTSEALDLADLQESGTFRKALWRKIQNAIVPILSELIAFIDKDGNLDLLQQGDILLTNLWLQIFKDNNLTQLRYKSFLTDDDDDNGGDVRSHVPVTSSGRDSHVFQCGLPFSGLLKEKVDELWCNAANIAGNSNESIEECLRSMITNSDVAVVMDTINNSQDFVERYIHDFVHMNYRPVKEGEDELVARAILVTARQLHALFVGNDADFTFPDIALVHKAYSCIERRLACFGQLVRTQPDIVARLLDVFTVDESEMTLDAIALQICMESLEPLQVDMSDTEKRKAWCAHVILLRAPAETMMGKTKDTTLIPDEKTVCILTHCRPLWERITAIRLFIEHVYPHKTTGRRRLQLDSRNIVKLCKALDEMTDFTGATSIEAVEYFLMECIRSFESSSAKDANEFRRRCNSFFMALISLLCFGGKETKQQLDPEVFDIFMRYITGSSSSQTKSFSPFPDFEVDETPVVRSFLLQQLLTTDSNKDIEKYIQRYLDEAQALSSDFSHVTRVCQLTVDCIEDSFAAQISERLSKLPLLIGVSTTMISNAVSVLTDVDNSDRLDYKVLEAISNTRHVLVLTAEWLFKSHMTDDVSFQDKEVADALNTLLSVVEVAFSEMRDRAPIVYLLKQIARRYGASVIRELTDKQQMSWLIPRGIDRSEVGDTSPDRFIVYSDIYMDTRDALARGLLSGTVDDLVSATQAHDAAVFKDVLCLLSIYREITCGYREPRQKLTEHKELREFLAQPDNLSGQARQLATKLLDNCHGEGFSALSAQPSQPQATIDLSEVVVHTMIVLQCVEDNELISTLKALMNRPASMLNSFLPTMPEDEFEKVKSGLTEPVAWHECPEGHLYSIGDCGRANQNSICPECKSGIGGTAYQLLPGNKPLTNVREDRSSSGHILGNANPNTSSLDIGQNLSPAAVHMIRLILHSAMLVGGCRHPEDAVQLFTPPIAQGGLTEFVWAHLTRDLRCLAAALNRSEDEALLTVHFVLSRITDVCAKSVTLYFGNGVLSSSSDRGQWEIEFTSAFIEPVLSTLEELFQNCFNIMSEDQRVGTDPLMREIYEIDSTEQLGQLNSVNPCFWRYRARVTVDHAKQMFSEKMEADKKTKRCKVLRSFFQEEHKLRVARYIPDINRLQRFLMDHCNRRIDKKKASEMTIKDFQKNLNKQAQREFKSLFTSFKAAWRAVHHNLEKQGRFKLSSETCSKTMDDTIPLSFILPISNGHESCTMAVLFYLINTHNEFLERYLNIIYGKASNASEVPLTEVTQSQLVSYDAERDLLPLIHAHCHYSLAVGQGTLLEYDWSAIQGHLIDRFIRGKSKVIFEETQFKFLIHEEDEIFFSVRNKIKQENILPSSVKMITSNLRRLNDVCEVKNSLELAIGFLASSGGNPTQLISDYLHDVLRIPQERGLRSRKAEQCCQLCHIIHLWQIVTLEKAKILLRQQQDPFEDLPDSFKVTLTRQSVAQFKKCLKAVDSNQLCLELLEMITLHLNEEQTRHGDTELQEYFNWVFEEKEIPIDNLDIPEDVLLKHVCNAWELVVEYIAHT